MRPLFFEEIFMPVIHTNSRPAKLLRNGHVQTILPFIFRNNPLINIQREKITMPDGEVLPLYLFKNNHKRLAIITHGLEGKGDDTYILHLAKNLNNINFDVVSWTMRSCGEHIITRPKLYNAVDSSDLEFVINSQEKKYDEIILIGISLGGSITANYVTRKSEILNPKIKRACVISTPLHLASSKEALENNISKFLYQGIFLKSMKKTATKLVKEFGVNLDLKAIKKARFISEIDHLVVAPMYHYKNGDDYREQGSALNHLNKTKIPLLIINSLDDPFLGKESFPFDIAKDNPLITLDTTTYGGHVGFMNNFFKGLYHHEKSLISWLNKKENY